MRKSLLLCAIATLVFSVTAISQNKRIDAVRPMKISNTFDRTVNPSHSVNALSVKATWDVAFTFNATAAGHVGIETDGANFYTCAWSSGDFARYSMDGTFDEIFTISGVTAIRDLTYDGTYFYGSSASMTVYIMDLANEALIGTIPVTCTGVTGVRHIAYDPTLDGGNGGFWVGNWNELGAISMTGAELVASTVILESCYGMAYDPYSDPANPCLWLFQQPTGAEAILYQFDINTYSMTGTTHDCSDAPGYVAASISGGACTYEVGGYAYLVANIQQEPNLIVAYELAATAEPTAPGLPTDLVANAAAMGALNADVSWTNPAVDVNGDVLSELTMVELFINDAVTAEYTNNTPVIGGAENYNVTVLTPGFYTFKVKGTNTSGTGLIATTTEWIGEDVPAAPENVVLTSTGMDASLSWTAPSAGLHGEYFSGTGLTYDVVRYPGAVLVADDQTELTFDETIAGAGNYYYIVIASNMSGVGGNAQSNTVLFGEVIVFDFEAGAPAGSELVNGTCGWLFGAAGGSTYFAIPAHGNYAYVNDDACNGTMNDVWMILPPMDFTGVAAPWMTFENVRRTDIFTIKVSVNGTTWDDVTTLSTDNIAAWQEENIDLSAYAEESLVYIAFHYNDNNTWGYGWAVDDIMLPGALAVIACPKPSNLTATTTLTTANLGWTETGTAAAWDIEWGLSGFTFGAGTMVDGATTNPYLLEGLTAGTSYDFYVRASCGGSDFSTWEGPFTFATECESISSYPYFEGFEAAVPPVCWSSNDVDGDGFNWEQIDYAFNSGDYAAMSASYDNDSESALTPDNYLISPNFEINADNLELRFFRAAVDADYSEEKYSVLVSTDGTAIADFTEIYTETIAADDNTYSEVVLSLAAYNGQSIYIALRHWGVTDMYQIAFDDFKVDFVSENNVVNAISKISVFPNPANEIVTVVNAENSNIVIVNMLGEVVKNVTNACYNELINISDLANGTYFIKVNSEVFKLNVVK